MGCAVCDEPTTKMYKTHYCCENEDCRDAIDTIQDMATYSYQIKLKNKGVTNEEKQ